MPGILPSAPLSLVLLAATLALVFTGQVTRYARRHGMLDLPGARSSHHEPTPRGGGAGLAAALIVTSLIGYTQVAASPWFPGILPGFALLALVGWWDDRASLSAWLRLAIQVVASAWILIWFHGYGWSPGWLGLVVAGAFVVAMTNLYNFMDGSNGMAGMQGVFAGLVLAWLFARADDPASAIMCLLMTASCAGFLPWNLGRARVFMGDVGSVALGFFFGAWLVHGVATGALALPVAWLVMLVFICDGSLTLLHRALSGERWYTPHKQHLYQRLIARGWSHGRVMLLYQAINLSFVLPAIVVAVRFPALALLTASLVTMTLLAGWFLVIKKTGVLAVAGKTDETNAHPASSARGRDRP